MSARFSPEQQTAADRAFAERAVASHNTLVRTLRSIVDACEGPLPDGCIVGFVEVRARVALAEVPA